MANEVFLGYKRPRTYSHGPIYSDSSCFNKSYFMFLPGEKCSFFCVLGAIVCGHKSFRLAWRCHQLLSGFLAKGHFSQFSRLLANDKGDNEMIPGAVHRSPGICLRAEDLYVLENPP